MKTVHLPLKKTFRQGAPAGRPHGRRSQSSRPRSPNSDVFHAATIGWLHRRQSSTCLAAISTVLPYPRQTNPDKQVECNTAGCRPRSLARPRFSDLIDANLAATSPETNGTHPCRQNCPGLRQSLPGATLMTAKTNRTIVLVLAKYFPHIPNIHSWKGYAARRPEGWVSPTASATYKQNKTAAILRLAASADIRCPSPSRPP